MSPTPTADTPDTGRGAGRRYEKFADVISQRRAGRGPEVAEPADLFPLEDQVLAARRTPLAPSTGLICSDLRLSRHG